MTHLANLDPAIQAKLKDDKWFKKWCSTGEFRTGLEPPKAFQGANGTIINVQAEK